MGDLSLQTPAIPSLRLENTPIPFDVAAQATDSRQFDTRIFHSRGA